MLRGLDDSVARLYPSVPNPFGGAKNIRSFSGRKQNKRKLKEKFVGTMGNADSIRPRMIPPTPQIAAGFLQLEHPAALWVGVGVAIIAGIVCVRASRPHGAAWLIAAIVSLACAAAGMSILRPERQRVAVMVDLSASTRTARYRDPAQLNHRISQLVGDTPRDIIYFSNGQHDIKGTPSRLPDLPGDHTVFAAPPRSAVVLFSDGQFAAPEGGAPPTFSVIDPGLDSPRDASVQQVELQKDAETSGIIVTAFNSTARELPVRAEFRSTSMPADSAAGQAGVVATPGGASILQIPIPSAASEVAVAIESADPWPENNAMRIRIPPPVQQQRWWVSERDPAPEGWRIVRPSLLPAAPAEYLAPSVIVLDNVSLPSLGPQRSSRIVQYVRDLGGALILNGGEHSFAAGGYTGSSIDSLSPLASTPPLPARQWLLLLDVSGSMQAATAGAGNLWDAELHAARGLLAALPPDDVGIVGGFSADLRWWSAVVPIHQLADIPLPPAGTSPRGTTNLEPALVAALQNSATDRPVEIMLVTDAEAEINDTAALADQLKSHRARLSVLAIGDGPAINALEQLCRQSNGRLVRQPDPHQWMGALDDLGRQAIGDNLIREKRRIIFAGRMKQTSAKSLSVMNRTWLRSGAALLATTDDPEAIPAAASWNAGAGNVLGIAFQADADFVGEMAQTIARPPVDPRLRLTWQTGRPARLTIEARDGQRWMNDLKIALSLSTDDGAKVVPADQTAPGRYEAVFEPPSRPTLAMVAVGGEILARHEIAGRYSAEFEHPGVDRASLEQLALRTGGLVIEPSKTTPIDFHFPVEDMPLGYWLSGLGALLAGIGLLRARR